MRRYKAEQYQLVYMSPKLRKVIRGVKHLHVKLPTLNLFPLHKLELISKTKYIKKSFTPINLTPPRLTRIPSPGFISKRSIPLISSSIKKSYFEHAFPDNQI